VNSAALALTEFAIYARLSRRDALRTVGGRHASKTAAAWVSGASAQPAPEAARERPAAQPGAIVKLTRLGRALPPVEIVAR
jgi:hypothetical protein